MDLSTKNVLFAVFCAASVSASDKMTCVIGYLNSCHENQKCVGISVDSRAGYCDCLEGYISVEDGPGGQVSKQNRAVQVSFFAIFQGGLRLQELDWTQQSIIVRDSWSDLVIARHCPLRRHLGSPWCDGRISGCLRCQKGQIVKVKLMNQSRSFYFIFCPFNTAWLQAEESTNEWRTRRRHIGRKRK